MLSTRSPRFTSLVFLLFLNCLPAELGAATWRILETENFVVLGDAREKDLVRTAAELELFRRTLSALFPRASFKHQMPVRVVVFSDDGSFRPFWPRSDGKPRRAAGYFAEGTPPLIAICQEAVEEARRMETGSVVLHEYVHYFLNNNFGYVPLWVNEGLAQVYSTFKVMDDGTVVRIGSPLPYQIGELRGRSMLQLEKLFEVEHDSPHYTRDNRDIYRFYAQSWALVHYLLMSERYAAGFPQFVTAVDRGTQTEDAFKECFETDLETMLRELDLYVRRVTLPARQHRFWRPFEAGKEGEVARLEEYEVEYYKAELLTRMGDREKGEKHFLRSLDLRADFVPSLVGLASIRQSEQKTSEAQKLLDRAETLEPEDFVSRMLLGTLQEANGQPDKAVEHFQRASAIHPETGAPHREIGLILLRQGDNAASETAFRRAVALEPHDLLLIYRRSWVLLERGRGEDAAREAAVFLRRHRWHNPTSAYAALVVLLGNLHQSGSEAVSKVLELCAEWEPPKGWPKPIFDYLAGKIDGVRLLGTASGVDEETEAHAYAGLHLVYTGRTAEALPHLEWVRDKGNRRFAEYRLVLAELERLNEPAAKRGIDSP